MIEEVFGEPESFEEYMRDTYIIVGALQHKSGGYSLAQKIVSLNTPLTINHLDQIIRKWILDSKKGPNPIKDIIIINCIKFPIM